MLIDTTVIWMQWNSTRTATPSCSAPARRESGGSSCLRWKRPASTALRRSYNAIPAADPRTVSIRFTLIVPSLGIWSCCDIASNLAESSRWARSVSIISSMAPIASARASFSGQLELAREFGLPVVLHIRRAVDDILKYLRRIPG